MHLPPLTSLVPRSMDLDVETIKTRIETASSEAVTGLRKDLVGFLGGDIGQAMLAGKALAHLNEERQDLTLRQSRMALTQNGLDQIKQSASGIGVRMLTALGQGDLPTQAATAQEARSALDQVLSTLNTRQGARYLFAGDATTTRPVPDGEALMSALTTATAAATDEGNLQAAIETFFNDPAGAWQASVYAGAQRSSDPDAVIAIDPAITQVISSLAALALSEPGRGSPLAQSADTVRESAALGLEQSSSNMTQLLAGLGLRQASADERLGALDSEETVLTRALGDLTTRDPYAAATQLRLLETNLEAAYLVTSRLSNLTLLNYIR